MKPTNLLIIGGAVVLGGLYLSNKSKKDKANAQALIDSQNQALASSIAQSQTNTPATQSVSTQALLTPKEATVYATKTIADVNSLLVKFPAVKKDEFIKNYNKAYGSNLFLENSGNITAPTPTTAQINAEKSGTLQLNQNMALEMAKQLVQSRVSDANRVFNTMQMVYTHWKSDFSTVYSNLKDYFTTLTKEQADVIIKYLPKVIVQSLMGDNDPRVKVNDFYSQEEIMGMVDNKIDQEQTLQSALGGFFMNIRQLNGEPMFFNNGVTIAVPSNVIKATGLILKNK
jgi:outer membrane murein-binding lipoprotein Lpp